MNITIEELKQLKELFTAPSSIEIPRPPGAIWASTSTQQWPIIDEQLAPIVKETKVPDKQSEEIVKPASILDEMTPEEILYYATPHYDEIQAEKQAHKEKLADEKLK